MSVKGTDYAGVTASLFGTVFNIRGMIVIHDLGGIDFGSMTKTIFRLDDLGAKYLQTKSNSILQLINVLRLRRWVYWPVCQVQKLNDEDYEQIGQNISRVHCMQRPEDPGGILSLNHKGMIGFLRVKTIKHGAEAGPTW